MEELRQINRKMVKRTVAILTGHLLNKFPHEIGLVEDRSCRVYYDDEEDFQHALGESVALKN